MIDSHNPAVINEGLLKGMYGNGGGSGSNLEIKTITFTGNGAMSVEIEFPEDPKLIWISSMGLDNHPTSSQVFVKENHAIHGDWFYQEEGVVTSYGGALLCLCNYDASTKKLTLFGGDDTGFRYNVSGQTTTVYYI